MFSEGTASGGACRPLLQIQQSEQCSREARKHNRKTAQNGKEKSMAGTLTPVGLSVVGPAPETPSQRPVQRNSCPARK